MCLRKRKLNYLKLHIKSTNTKQFSPVAVDSIIRNFVTYCNFTKSCYISTNSYNTLCVGKHSILGPKYTVKLTASGGLCPPSPRALPLELAGGLSFFRPPAYSPQYLA